MTFRRLLSYVALSFALGFAASALTAPPRQKSRARDDFDRPETIEVFRAATATLPEVADTIRFDRPAGRPAWVVRVKYADRVFEYRGEAVNHPPG